jgi:hypothetical protein
MFVVFEALLCSKLVAIARTLSSMRYSVPLTQRVTMLSESW